MAIAPPYSHSRCSCSLVMSLLPKSMLCETGMAAIFPVSLAVIKEFLIASDANSAIVWLPVFAPPIIAAFITAEFARWSVRLRCYKLAAITAKALCRFRFLRRTLCRHSIAPAEGFYCALRQIQGFRDVQICASKVPQFNGFSFFLRSHI